MDLEDFDNVTAYARYRRFGVGLLSVDPEEDGFPLTVADYSGTAGRRQAAGRRSPRGRTRRGCRRSLSLPLPFHSTPLLSTHRRLECSLCRQGAPRVQPDGPQREGRGVRGGRGCPDPGTGWELSGHRV